MMKAAGAIAIMGLILCTGCWPRKVAEDERQRPRADAGIEQRAAVACAGHDGVDMLHITYSTLGRHESAMCGDGSYIKL